MSKLEEKDAPEKYQMPNDLSIPDFLRRAVAETTSHDEPDATTECAAR